MLTDFRFIRGKAAIGDIRCKFRLSLGILDVFCSVDLRFPLLSLGIGSASREVAAPSRTED